uniref:Mucolipin TRP cation channel 2 n=1 Tax=Macaca fascicularis TaxID=9541 RepID=A0A7N9DCE4_MACFA
MLGVLPLPDGAMPPGMEVLDLPLCNRFSGLSWGPHHRSVPPGAPWRAPRLPGGPTAAPFRDYLLPRFFSRALAPSPTAPTPPPRRRSPSPGARGGWSADAWNKCPRTSSGEAPVPGGRRWGGAERDGAGQSLGGGAGAPGHAPHPAARAQSSLSAARAGPAAPATFALALGPGSARTARPAGRLVRFGLSNQLVVAFKEDNTVAFKHLFLKGYSGTDEDDYSCSVYTQEDAYESIFFAINQYHQLKDITLGTLGYGENEDNRIGLKVCKQHYKKGTMFPSNETLNIDNDIELDCVHLDLQDLSKDPPDWKNSSFFRLEFYRLLQVEISFRLKGIDLQTIHSRELPDCYVFQNTASIFVLLSTSFYFSLHFLLMQGIKRSSLQMC